MGAPESYPNLKVRLPSGNSASQCQVQRSTENGSCTKSGEGCKDESPMVDIRRRYSLGPRVGKGHSGVVHVCEDRITGELLACKSISKAKLKAKDKHGRNKVGELAAEITAMKRLEGCPKAVHLRDLYEDDEAVHLVMDYCSQGDLFEFLSQRRRLSEGDVARLLSQLALALKHCASKGVIHRDIKPENIFITSFTTGPEGTPNPQVKIGDFGLAVPLTTSRALAKGVAGSCLYMAPELVRGNEYDAKIDVWSLGVTIYTALIGFLPYWGRTTSEIFATICRDAPDYSQDPWPQISLEAKDLVQWMLEPRPELRASADDILNHPWVRSVSNPTVSPRVARQARWLSSSANASQSPPQQEVAVLPHPPQRSSSTGGKKVVGAKAHSLSSKIQLPLPSLCSNPKLPPVQTRESLPALPPCTRELSSGAFALAPRPPASPRSPISSPSRHTRQAVAGLPLRTPPGLPKKSQQAAPAYDEVCFDTAACRLRNRSLSGASSLASGGSMSPTSAANFFRGLDSPNNPLDGRFFEAMQGHGHSKAKTCLGPLRNDRR